MSLGSGEGFWEIFADSRCGETWPGLEETSIDGFDPSGGDGAECSGMEEFNEIGKFGGLVCVVTFELEGQGRIRRDCGIGEWNAPEASVNVSLSG